MIAFWTELKCFSDVEQMENHWTLELEGILESSSLALHWQANPWKPPVSTGSLELPKGYRACVRGSLGIHIPALYVGLCS